jgi:orotate phosphoribosyltransferase|tara:strand:- start:39804 stop:40460 length:657 start_codon:yes stop_codon:yes gene_type:complete
MVIDSVIAKKLANFLLQIKAIELRPKNPFIWASGLKSPIYCDNRIILSNPKVRNFVQENLSFQIKEKFPDVQVIAGVATGAIGIAALVAHQLDLPMIYVRPSAKGHGRQNLIEGRLKNGQKVVIVEDLISTGMSSLKAFQSVIESKGEVLGMSAIFTYGFDIAKVAFLKKECDLITISDYSHLISSLKDSKSFNSHEISALESWRENPKTWNGLNLKA